VRWFEQALTLNPGGVAAADGMTVSGIVMGNEALKATWMVHKAQMQGKAGQRSLPQRWDQRGRQFSQNGDYPHAIVAYEQALAMAREINDRVSEGTALSNLGWAYGTLSQYERAISFHEQALAIAQEGNNRTLEGSALNNLGRDYLRLS